MKRAVLLLFLFIFFPGCASLNLGKSQWREKMAKETAQTANHLGQLASGALSGKELWLKSTKLSGCDYDSSQFPAFSQVEIMSVIAAVTQPLVDMFRVTAQMKYKDVQGQISFTVLDPNLMIELGGNPIATTECFYDFDPKKTYKMSEKDWALIANSSFRIGFSTNQLELSIGEPDRINRTVTPKLVREQWVYDKQIFRGYIFFENGKLSSWQD